MLDLIDAVGVLGIAVMGYFTYGVCRVDRGLCRVGVVGVVLVLLAYIGRYVDVDRSLAVFVVLLAVAVAVAVLSGRL
jgi:hypothetical protein